MTRADPESAKSRDNYNLHPHYVHAESKVEDGLSVEATFHDTGPRRTETTDKAAHPNGKCSATMGANCYERNVRIGRRTGTEDTKVDTLRTPRNNTNLACIRYHFD